MRVLVASDDSAVSEKVCHLLHNDGYESEAVRALDLESATDHVIQFHPDAIVLVLSPNPDRALAALREFGQFVPARVLAVGPADDAQMILRTLQEGAYQYLDESTLNSQLLHGLRRLRSESPLQIQHGRVISVLGTSGGAGASTLAVNLASVLAGRYERTALIDLNLEAGDLAAMLNMSPGHSVADFCRNVARMDNVMFEQCFEKHDSGIRLLGAPESHLDRPEITPRGIRKLLCMARSNFPFVVVDVERPFGEEYAQALLQADVILLVVRLDFASLRRTARAISHLVELGIDEERVRLVANRYQQPKELRIPDVEKALKRKVSFFIPNDPRYINAANNNGVPVVRYKPRAKSSQTIAEIAWSVNGVAAK